MEFNRSHFPADFLPLQKCFHAAESYHRIITAFPGETPSRSTAFDCYSEFHPGPRSLEDEEHAGKPLSATIEHHVTAVRTMLDEDARVTVIPIARCHPS